jgi:predicted adenylyl cyclase CyaB
LIGTFGKLVTVEKKRSLWMYKNTRIHIDNVKDLGRFLELETVVKNGDIKKAKKEYAEIMELLNLSRYKKERESYSDLLLKKHKIPPQLKQKINQPKDVITFLKNKL